MQRKSTSSDYEELMLLKDLAGDISFALDYIGKEEKLTLRFLLRHVDGLANRHCLRPPGAGVALGTRRATPACGHDHRLATFQKESTTRSVRYAGDQVLRNSRAGCSGRSVSPPLRRASAAIVLPSSGSQSSGNVDGALDRRLDRRLFREPLIIDEIELRRR